MQPDFAEERRRWKQPSFVKGVQQLLNRDRLIGSSPKTESWAHRQNNFVEKKHRLIRSLILFEFEAPSKELDSNTGPMETFLDPQNERKIKEKWF